MKAKLRRQLAARLKELKIPVKLYRGAKLLFYRRHRAQYMREMLDKLQYVAPGTLVEDCDSFNHVVKGFLLREKFRHSNAAWYGKPVRGYFFDFDQVVFEDGGWSCGCPSPGLCPPRTREEIEADYLQNFDGVDMETAVDDWTKKPYDTLTKARITALRSGGHICDERGVVLVQFARLRAEAC